MHSCQRLIASPSHTACACGTPKWETDVVNLMLPDNDVDRDRKVVVQMMIEVKMIVVTVMMKMTMMVAVTMMMTVVTMMTTVAMTRMVMMAMMMMMIRQFT